MSLRFERDAEPIPGYRLIERLGGGGFGEVWKATAPGGLLKAIKIIHGNLGKADDQAGHLAAQELRALKRVQAIRHPYLLSLERYDVIEGRLLIVTELADCNLWDRFRECRSERSPGIPREELMQYMLETAEVLDMMNNQHGLQHLDIKPQNLFLIYNHIKVADFGLVKDLEGMRAEVTGGVTPVYAAPETFDGVVTRFCDQYSLAIVYQELLTGIRPFNGTSAQQLLVQHLQGTPNLAPLPTNERGIVARALAKKPEDRFPNCLQFVRALLNMGNQPNSLPLQGTYPPPLSRIESPFSTRSSPDLESAAPPPETPKTEFRLRQDQSASVSSISVEYTPQRIAPPEITGPGVLRPTLIVGLGQTGFHVLQKVRELVADRLVPVEKIPMVKLTYIDTDPVIPEGTTRTASPLTNEEILPARLNRSAHYLKPRRNARSLVEGWLDPQLLYRITRNPETLGIRAFGRLAYLDHYRNIAEKLRIDLEVATHADSVAETTRVTGLEIRTNRPRVYIVCHLGGATGSGMFLDAAYTLRHKLRLLGYAQPEIVGLFLVPPSERSPGRTQVSLSNTYAALRELNHYSLPETVFQAAYDERDGNIADANAPFSRVVIIPMPNSPTKATNEVASAVGPFVELLYRETFLPFGRAADEARNELPRSKLQELLVETFSYRKFTWPRQQILNGTARWLADTLLSRWVDNDSTHLKDHIQQWLEDRWKAEQCTPDAIIGALRRLCEREIGDVIENMAVQETTPFVPKGWFSREPDSNLVWQSVSKFQNLVGMPDETAMQRQAGRLEFLIGAQGDLIARELGTRLTNLIKALLEHPDYRIIGAEEAIRQLQALLESQTKQYESLAADLGKKSCYSYYLVQHYLTGEPGRKRPSVSEMVEHLKLFPKWRQESLILRQVARVYRSILVQIADVLREVRYCRQRLEDLVKSYRQPSLNSPSGEIDLLPPGCNSLDEAIRSLRKSITPEDLRSVDEQIQTTIEQEFQALFSVCLSSMNMIGSLQQTIDRQAKSFLQNKLREPDFLEMLQAKFGSIESLESTIKKIFDEANPTLPRLGKEPVGELNLIGLPLSKSSEKLQELIGESLPGATIHFLTQPDEIVIQREFCRFPLADLPQLGPIAEAAYQESLSNPACPPHCRNDVPEWYDVEVS